MRETSGGRAEEFRDAGGGAGLGINNAGVDTPRLQRTSHSERRKLRNRRLGLAVLALAIVAGAAIAGIVIEYLPEHQIRWVIAGAILIGSPIVGQILNRLIGRLPETRSVHAGITAILAVAVLLPLASAVYPQRVTYSRFGLTVWGAVPLPFVDIRVNRDGLLWFRPKTHMITMDEVKRLLSPDIEIVVIGTGWRENAQVELSVRELTECEVRLLPTPDALSEFNRLRSEGRQVVLLAHSTC